MQAKHKTIFQKKRQINELGTFQEILVIWGIWDILDIWRYKRIFGDIFGHPSTFGEKKGHSSTCRNACRNIWTFRDMWGHLGTFWLFFDILDIFRDNVTFWTFLASKGHF
jgi:hypothetical protein